MTKDEVIEFVKEWLNKKKIKTYFEEKKKNKKRYIKISEDELYNLCYKLIDLVDKNIV